MSISSPTTGKTDDFSADPSTRGPAPHEDLTIGELLESMRAPDEDRPGEQCFINVNREACWVADSEVHRFLTEYGAEHPSTYHRLHGVDWHQHFFKPTPE